ncbi:MAG: alpha/beta hydrolase [Janthinobacterium lividum]
MMNETYYINENRFIAYYHYKSNKKNIPYVIFLHGLMSDMNGLKAQHIEKHCRNLDYNFVKFDNFGHGKSSGEFAKETISSWLMGLEIVINNLTHGPVLIVGSSMGGWVALLAAMNYPDRVQGLVCLAPAVDFTHNAIWQKLTPDEQKEIQREGSLIIGGDKCDSKYIISYQLITEARDYLLLDLEKININCNVQIIHGLEDEDVEPAQSNELVSKITSSKIVLKFIKDGDHKLSRASDLKIITNSIDEMVGNILTQEQT